jgi:orotidine-5'-phosphate decarboxylase
MKLCVALDLPSKEENLALVRQIKDEDLWFKVGLRSFIRDGQPFLDEIKSINPQMKIFLDLKLYDIPNTMADASEAIATMGVDMFNVHASSGTEAMQTVMKRLENIKNRPLVLAVTALTSFDNDGFSAVYNSSIEEKAKAFAKSSFDAGLDGVVSSVFESASIKKATNDKFVTLTPGVRPFGEASDDQKRVATVAMAHEQKVDFIVVGRPIYRADNPLTVVKKILEQL